MDPTRHRLTDINKKTDMARSVLQTCKAEQETIDDVKDDIERRVMTYTGTTQGLFDSAKVPPVRKERTFDKWAQEGQADKNSSKYKEIRSYLIKKYIEEREVPSQADIEGFFTMTDLAKAGYIWIKLPKVGKSIVVERPDHLKKRMHYLKNILKYREARRSIVYIEHREIEVVTSVVNKMTVCIVGNCNGLYHIEVCSDSTSNLPKIVNNALPYIPATSVIVLPERKSLEEQPPTEYSTKAEMSQWLTKYEVPHDKDEHRAELFNLIQKTKNSISADDLIDVLFKANGHDVLRRPEDHEMFNFYSYLKIPKVEIEVFEEDSFIESLRETVGSLLESSETVENEMVLLEQKYKKEDYQMEVIIDKLIIMAKGDPKAVKKALMFHQVVSEPNLDNFILLN